MLVNNAGVGRAIQSLPDADPADIDQTIATNVTAALHAVRSVVGPMIERGRGHIVNVGSVAGLYPLLSGVYGASKGAIHLMSTNLRLELAGTGVRVTEICPGRVRTEFYDAAIGGKAAMANMGATGISELQPEDIVSAILFALKAPLHVNISTIELLPTEQTVGGVTATPISKL